MLVLGCCILFSSFISHVYDHFGMRANAHRSFSLYLSLSSKLCKDKTFARPNAMKNERNEKKLNKITEKKNGKFIINRNNK